MSIWNAIKRWCFTEPSPESGEASQSGTATAEPPVKPASAPLAGPRLASNTFPAAKPSQPVKATPPVKERAPEKDRSAEKERAALQAAAKEREREAARRRARGLTPPADWSQTKRVLEIGLGDGARADALIAEMTEAHGPGAAAYVGVDLFEMGPAGGLTLKGAFARFRAAGAEVKLIPGDVLGGAKKLVYQIPAVDLLVISADQPAAQLAAAWPTLVHLISEKSAVFLEEATAGDGPKKYQRLTYAEVQAKSKVRFGRSKAA